MVVSKFNFGSLANQQISGQKSIAVVDVVQNQVQFVSHPCGHKTGRFQARRALLWSMLFKNYVQFLAHTPLVCIDATFSNFPLAIWKWLITALPMHHWTQYYQTAGQKSVISTVMHARAYQDSLSLTWDDRIHDSYHHSWAIKPWNPYLLCDEPVAL